MSDLISEGVASGEDAMTLLDNPRTRNLFLDDLFEVRLYEIYLEFQAKKHDNQCRSLWCCKTEHLFGQSLISTFGFCILCKFSIF